MRIYIADFKFVVVIVRLRKKGSETLLSCVILSFMWKKGFLQKSSNKSILLFLLIKVCNFFLKLCRHGNERADSSYPSILQEDLNSSLNYRQETGVDCSHELGKNFSTITEDSSRNSFKHQDFTLGMNPITSSTNTDQSTVISSSFPMNSSFSNYPSALLQTLFDNDPPPPQQQPQQQSLFTNNNQPMNFPATLNYRPNLNDHFSPSLPKFPPLLRPSLPKQTPSSFPFTDPTSLNNMRGNLLPSMHSQLLLQSPTFHEKSSVPNNSAKVNTLNFKYFCTYQVLIVNQ